MDDVKGATPVRIILWAPPRSLSTAFERCIASSDDSVRIYHEMFTAACHLGPERQIAIPVPAAKKLVEDRRFRYEWVRKQLERKQSAGTSVVFCKELAYSIHGHFSSIPAGFKHTFLIRHPAKVFLSMNKLIEKFISKHLLNLSLAEVLPPGLVFKEMYELFCYITNTLGQDAIIIDADDLIEHPESTIRAYCQAVGIPFSSTMMHWNPLSEEKNRWTFSKRLMLINKLIGQYDRAFSTSRLEQAVEKPLDLTKVTPEVLRATEASVQYYEMLYRLRLKPAGGDPLPTTPSAVTSNNNKDSLLANQSRPHTHSSTWSNITKSDGFNKNVSSGFDSEEDDDVFTFEENSFQDTSCHYSVNVNIEIDD